MGDGKIVKLPVPKDARRSAGRAGLGIGVRPAAAVAAEGLHDRIIEPIGRRAKTAVSRAIGTDRFMYHMS